jgi:hypothetical protein
MITIRPSHSFDVGTIAPHMRLADQKEVLAASGHTPHQALRQALKVSAVCMTACLDGNPIAMFGVNPDLDLFKDTGVVYGHVWFLGTDESTQDPKGFMRASRKWLGILSEKYTALGNVVDARNSKHIRWIKAMGFDFIDTHTNYGKNGETFLQFFRTTEEPQHV